MDYIQTSVAVARICVPGWMSLVSSCHTASSVKQNNAAY